MEQSAESSNGKPPAWSKQSFLKLEKIPTVNEIIGLANSIDSGRNRCLFVLTYLTAGRIREIVRTKDRKSITKSDMSLVTEEGRTILLINIRNQKNRERKRKDIPIPLDIKENALLWNMILDYINSIKDNEELFPICYQNAYEIITNLTTWNPHWIRHIRLTHLVTVYGYKEHQLRIYAGWTDSRPAKNYIEMNWKDLLY